MQRRRRVGSYSLCGMEPPASVQGHRGAVSCGDPAHSATASAERVQVLREEKGCSDQMSLRELHQLLSCNLRARRWLYSGRGGGRRGRCVYDHLSLPHIRVWKKECSTQADVPKQRHRHLRLGAERAGARAGRGRLGRLRDRVTSGATTIDRHHV